MPCRKIAHPTHAAALAHQKELVWRNHVCGHDARSARLHTYPCDRCPAWHVGHSSLRTPTVYHYALTEALDGILKADALRPRKPHRIAKRNRRRYAGPALARLNVFNERAALLWFSWNAAWTAAQWPMPHPPATFTGGRDGLMRIGVSASVATLRWSDYLRLNHTARSVRDGFARQGYPPDWLATAAAVPFGQFRSIECWAGDGWLNLAEIPDAEFAAAGL